MFIHHVDKAPFNNPCLPSLYVADVDKPVKHPFFDVEFLTKK
jgi:hypothetical protein